MQNVVAVILAAGKGKRMKSGLPKVLHTLHGKPLLTYVLETCRQADVGRTIVIVGFQGERVIEVAQPFDAEIVWQREQLGTGHAVQQAQPLLQKHTGEVVVMNGDVPLISAPTVQALVQEHRVRRAAATILTAEMENPTGYGRVIRQENGLVAEVVEEVDADESTRRIREINSGMFCFSATYLFKALQRVKNDNQQGEYYLPDVVSILQQDGHPVAAQKVTDSKEVLGVNDPGQLKQLANLQVKR